MSKTYDIPACKRNKKEADMDVEADSDSDTEKETSGFVTLLMSPNYKMAIFIFILFMFLMSNMFIEMVLAKISNKLVEGNNPTSHGILVLGIIMTIGYLLFDLLVKSGTF